MSNRSKTLATAEHRPAVRRRRFKHDNPVAGDFFSGFGGLTQGIQRAGFDTIVAANHSEYKTRVHEANHPEVEHWIADLVDTESPAYQDVRDLPAVDFLGAGVSCINHSLANTMKAYASGMSLFDMDDPEFDARVTRSEKDRATANCVLHYAARHHPRLILVECTTELQSWGPALPGRPKVGDGTTYRWWLKQFELLGYRCRVLFLNSMFFGTPQSRDRLYIALWDAKLPTPDLDHRPPSWCVRCDRVVEAVWSWRTGIPATGRVTYGRQYDYRCPSCRRQVIPPMAPSITALDLTDLGTRIGDRPARKQRDGSTGPLAAATLARAERCRQRFAEFPAVLMPAKAERGTERHPWEPLGTQTSQQETALLSTGMIVPAHRHNGDGKHVGAPMDTVTSTHEKALLSTGAIMVAAGNTYERPGSECRTRGLDEPLWTQLATNTTGLVAPPMALAVNNYQGEPRGSGEPLPTQAGSETLSLLSARVMPNRTNATSRDASQPMETVVAGAGSGGLGILSSGVVPYRQHTTPTSHAEAMPTVTADQIPGLLTAAGRVQCNGDVEQAKYRAHPLDHPLGTVVGSASNQGLLFSGWASPSLMAEWRAALADLALEDCYFRMLGPHEVGRGCGFDTTFPGQPGEFVVWGSDREQVDGFGNAVSPPVGEWIGLRLRTALHPAEAVMAG